MKRIRKLQDFTPGLEAYLEECDADSESWEGFRNHAAGASRRELVVQLVSLQRGLCGYCEIDLTERDVQVEHVIPRSDPNRGALEELNPGNMVACCLGGAARNLYGPGTNGDEGRYLKPVKANLSCGQAKGEAIDTEFVDPRTLPALPSVTKVYPNGVIEADQHACAGCGVSANRVNRTIEILGLNAERLRLRREKRWQALNQSWRVHFNNPVLMAQAAREEIIPSADGHLPRFFTTSRSYFAPFGEGVLQQNPDHWV